MAAKLGQSVPIEMAGAPVVVKWQCPVCAAAVRALVHSYGPAERHHEWESVDAICSGCGAHFLASALFYGNATVTLSVMPKEGPGHGDHQDG